MFQIYGNVQVLLEHVRHCRETLRQDALASQQLTGFTGLVPYPLRGVLKDYLENIETLCKTFEIGPALDRIARIRVELDRPDRCTYTSLSTQFQTLYENIEDDLRNRTFWYIPLDNERYRASVKDIPFK